MVELGSFLVFAALFQIDGAQAVAAGMLRGLHDTMVPMIYAAIGYWASACCRRDARPPLRLQRVGI